MSPEHYSVNTAASANLAGAAICNLLFDSLQSAALQFASLNSSREIFYRSEDEK
jgi:hypothetical protein